MASKRVLTKLSDFISMADIFNDPIYLNMKGRRKLATSLGGILSAGLIVFLLCLGILQSVSMFSREDPQVYQISELEDDPTAIYLNGTNNFMFAIALSEYSQPINMSLNSPFFFNITFNQYIRFTDGTRKKYKNKINLAPCTADQFPSNVYGENVFSSYELAYAYCPINIDFSTGLCPAEISALYPDCKTPLNLKVSGSYLSIDFEFVQFNLYPCKSTDKLPVGFKCTTENVTTLLNSKEYKVNLFYANSVTNPMFYKTPNKTYIETIHWDLNPLISKVADIFVDKEISQDYDSYWSTTSYENKTFYSIQPDKMRELQVFQTTTGSALLQWNIRRSSVNVVTTRTYSKIQDVMTDLGGFSKAVMFIAAFIAVGYVEYKYQLTLSNEFYDFQMDQGDSDKKKKSKKDSKNPRENNYKVNNAVGLPFAHAMAKETSLFKKEDEPVEKATKAVQEYFTQQKDKRKGINFGLIKYFKMVARWLSCRRNAEDEVAEKARNLVQDELDIIRVIQKLKEIDKLKVLLLNRYQREVFNFIEKPLVTLDSEKPIHLDSMLPDLSFELNESGEEEDNPLSPKMPNTREEYDALPKYAKLYMAYKYLMEDKHSGNQKYNKKLMDMIGDDLIDVFKKVDQVMDENPDPRKFDEMIKTVFKPAEENDAE